MRISWDEYFIACLDAAALRASCDRGKSGAIIVKDNRILATGYVGAPSGIPSCDEVGHQLVSRCEMPFEISQKEWSLTKEGKAKTAMPIQNFSTHCIRTVHAEQNAIINCARNGVSTLGATIYCTMTPCTTCAMSIIQAGILNVVAKNNYQKDQYTKELFNTAGINLTILNQEELY
jgi:dCMP deaminase